MKDVNNLPTRYECAVTINYEPDDRDVVEVVSADSLTDLYRELGQYKAQETVVDSSTRWDYPRNTVNFGEIREIIVVTSSPVDADLLKDTPAMRDREARRQQKITAEQAVAAERMATNAKKKADKEAKKVANELAELARLQEKYRT
jgi:hypothetical protein